MQTRRIQQLGLFLATVGASLLLSGAAHAAEDVTSPGQSSQTTDNQEITVDNQSPTATQSTTTDNSGAATVNTAPSDTSGTASPSSDTKAPAAAVSQPVTVAPATTAPQSTPPAQTTTSPVAEPLFFQPVTFIQALVPQIATTAAGATITMPNIKPAAPAGPVPPGSPTGALVHVSDVLGAATVPAFLYLMHGLTGLSKSASLPILVILLTSLVVSTFATFLRRWGYAVSPRGPGTWLANLNFAFPVMRELMPVRIRYPG